MKRFRSHQSSTRRSAAGLPAAVLIILVSLIILIAGGCADSTEPEGREPSDAPGSALLENEFEDLLQEARDSTVRFYMWGGSPQVNAWVDGELSEYLMDTYGITLERVPMDAGVFVNRLLSEKEAGREEGIMDLLWINGENFRNAREGDILFGPFTHSIPNHRDLVDPSTTVSDAGFPVDGYEAPYGKAQFVMEYDSAQISDPPDSYAELLEWARENPGLLTYPQPPDFTGSAFIRQAFYELTGGYEQYQEGFDADLFQEKVPALWDYLNALEPYLWREGETYPADLASLDGLFERGEVAFNMTFTQTGAAGKIAQGRYPETVRTFVFENASLANTHYIAIPFNAPNKAGAMAAINGILSPEMQLSKNDPENWGDFTVLDTSRLSEEMRRRFAALDLGEATLDLDVLSSNAVPEIASDYIEALEQGWKEHVLNE
ncbi:ABC transporter substrate-binding protein [Salinispira pacifica]|uniref:ABC transporter, periplasmic substrate-binding protein YnjB n=1 Tax=Salinispira pacifica TaxID=1307761 RepID=V5WJF1_9SPIO|nr:ABC transporter substrate-binding protein [Salinispira pacifica]AHC15679.1 ABC transporter, periplasmic substrate-binding protein YnjB [Salinispira pacifica]